MTMPLIFGWVLPPPPLPCGGIDSAVFDICVGRQIRIFNYISCLDKGVLWQSSMPVRTSISQSSV